jgi:diacylglycerol kinase (ATP)
MKGREKFSLKSRIRSFGYALSGLKRFFGTEHNAWIHLAAALAAAAVGFLLNISPMEWVGVLFAIGLVCCAEAFNTCVEKMMDRLLPQQDETVKYIKDLAAGAVLISAAIAALVGTIIFLPKIIALF